MNNARCSLRCLWFHAQQSLHYYYQDQLINGKKKKRRVLCAHARDPPFRSDRRAASRRRFRRFALVRHNCFRPSSRLRQHDIVSFRYFRFQAHRSMSALPLPRDPPRFSPGLSAVLVFFSLASRFERAALRRRREKISGLMYFIFLFCNPRCTFGVDMHAWPNV